MAPELPGSHSSGPAEKEKTAKGGEGREAEEPESSAYVSKHYTEFRQQSSKTFTSENIKQKRRIKGHSIESA